MEFQHVKPGKGAAFIEQAQNMHWRYPGTDFSGGIHRARLDKRNAYLYNDGEDYVFMDTEL